jgi:hypothetical protein
MSAIENGVTEVNELLHGILTNCSIADISMLSHEMSPQNVKFLFQSMEPFKFTCMTLGFLLFILYQTSLILSVTRFM